MTGLDLSIGVLVIWRLWRGLKAGLIGGLIGLLGGIAALWFGSRLATTAAPLFSSVVTDPVLQRGLAFLVLVLIAVAMLWALGALLRSALNALHLGSVDKIAGGTFGAAQGVLIALIALNLVGPWLSQTALWQRSHLAPALLPYAPLAAQMSGDAARSVAHRITDSAVRAESSVR